MHEEGAEDCAAEHHVSDSMEVHRKHAQSQGNLLAMALAFMVVLVTVVIAMHTTQVRANRTVTQAEAELQFRQAAEFETVNVLFDDVATPDTLRVKADSELLADQQMPAHYASQLWKGLPDWRIHEDQEFAPGHRTVQLLPSTNDQALNVFAGKFLWMISHGDGGYAVYAPGGKITLSRGQGWPNPALADDLGIIPGLRISRRWHLPNRGSRARPYSPGRARQPSEMFSGVPFLLAARDSIEVAGLPYGNAYSEKGPIDLGDNPRDLAVGFIGSLPLRRYEKKLQRDLEAALVYLRRQTEAADKSAEIGGQGRVTVSALLDMMLTGKSGALRLNLEQALKFPFPTLPGSATLGPDLFDVWLHMPFTPDFFDATGVPDAGLAPEDAPKSRAQDASIPDTGIKGWNYRYFFSQLPEILVYLSSGDLRSLAASIPADVRLVHFGGKDNDMMPGFAFGQSFGCEATFTVPRGRPFKYRGNMEIVGDLWLQKGAVMHVGGNLVLRQPPVSGGRSRAVAGNAALQPSGKLILEQGATLIVDGDFRCEGTQAFGSLWVCAPPNQISPVSSAILVHGTARFPYGSFSASSLDDMAAAIEGLKGVSEALGPLLTETAPNLAKAAGPFYQRKPYFASFATTFQLKMVTEAGGKFPVPTATPRPLENALIPFFRALTGTYTSILNASLGENLYTHADWWPFGEGVAAVTLKLDPTLPAVKSAMNVNLSGVKPYGSWAQDLPKLASMVYQGAAEFVIAEVGQKLASAVMVTEAASDSASSDEVKRVRESVDQHVREFDSFRDDLFRAAWKGGVSGLKQLASALDREVRNGIRSSYLREVTGPLIYADDIFVGDTVGYRTETPLLMAGMLVANNRLVVEADSFVGSLTSFRGDITAQKVYFTPLFTRASLYLPSAPERDPQARTAQYQYGQGFDSGQTVDVGTGVHQITTEAWNR